MADGTPSEGERVVDALVDAYRDQRALLRVVLTLLREPGLTTPDPAAPDWMLAVLPVGLIQRIEQALGRGL